MQKFLILFLSFYYTSTFAQTLQWKGQALTPKNVHASLVDFNGEEVLKVERDLKALPFDINRLESTVDEPTYVKFNNIDFRNGTIEVKMLSRIQNPSPFEYAQGFIGLAFRIDENDTAFESIYLRPKVGRSDNQLFRNHTVQYFAYPNFKFETLRKEAPGMYEGAAPVNINEWITMRIEVEGQKATLFINDAIYSTFVVHQMKGSTTHGSVALWVDIATEGYFKDFKVIPSRNRVQENVQEWERAKAYTLEYLQAMPESGYSLKPTPAMRSFAQQMLHIADANYAFASAVSGVKSPFEQGQLKKTPKPSKATVTKIVLEAYDFTIQQINNLKPEQMEQPVLLFGQFNLPRETILAKLFEHQTHHRGQTTVYLRLAGITPTQEKLF